MKKNLLITIIFFCFCFLAQSQTCDNFRYLNDITTSVSSETVQFGTNINGAGASQDLFMDIYTPDNDTETDRPVIMFAFGGSFIGGSRGDSYVVDFCEQYAKLGYVTVGIDYRLYNVVAQGFPDSLDMIEEVIMAVADMKGAIRYMRKTAAEGNPYGINPDLIFAGGVSAGAIAAAHSAYVNELEDLPTYVSDIVATNGGIDGDTDLAGDDSHAAYSSSVQAVVSMSGAIHRVSFMETGDAPIVSMHGDADDVVPYGFDYANVAGFPIATVQGSSLIHAKALELGIPSELYTVPGGGHTNFYWTEPHQSIYDEMIQTFLYDEAVCQSVNNENLLDVSKSVSVYPNPAEGETTIAMNGSLGAYEITIVDQLGRKVRQVNGLDTPQYTLEQADLVAGIYFVNIIFENEDLAPVNKRVVFK